MLFSRAAVLAVSSALSVIPLTTAAFGYQKTGNNIVVDAGSTNSLLVTIDQYCNFLSILYKGSELQYPSVGSQINSGITYDSVTPTQTGNFIKVSCVGSLSQTFVFVKGESNIYMGTHTTESMGELRWIFRLNNELLPSQYPHGIVSDVSGSSSAIEGEDVYLVGTQTRSKFYSADRFIDRGSHCVYGSGSGIWLCLHELNMETSSGGPFFRDIESANSDGYQTLYNYMTSQHTQTEVDRLGFHGPYVASFSGSDFPSSESFDASFFGNLSIDGYIPDTERGFVSGTVFGTLSGLDKVVHLFNEDAQYWTYAAEDGTYTSPAMKPGWYTVTLYQNEFNVAYTKVTVTKDQTASVNLRSTFSTAYTTLFKIGEYDSQPFELLNGDKFLRMHPSDARMSSWTIDTYDSASSAANDWPMAMFKDVNNGGSINFKLATVPTGTVTMRIATTIAYSGARPNIQVNSWQGTLPGAPVAVPGRAVTRGAYRGLGEVYEWIVPNSALIKGNNLMTVTVASGSSGTGYLSPNVVGFLFFTTNGIIQSEMLTTFQVFDCLELFTV